MSEVALRNTVQHVSLISEKEGLVRNLAGFKKTHRIPESTSPRDATFISNIAAPQIDNELEAVFRALRENYGFKRKEIDVTGPEEGFGAITTPQFSFSISIAQHPQQPGTFQERQVVSEISNPEESLGESFESVFGNRFFTLEVVAKQNFDIEGIVDRAEDGNSSVGTIEYDRNATWCQIVMGGIQVYVTEDTVKIVDVQRTHKTKDLFAAFATVQQQFLDMLT